MYEEKTDNKGLSFYGTFVLIYTVLNIAAFLIMLLMTEWSVLADDEGDGFWAGFFFMVIGIAAALIHGIGPALTFKRRGNTRLLYLFPLAVMLVGFTVFPFESLALAFAIGGFLIMPLAFRCSIASHTLPPYTVGFLLVYGLLPFVFLFKQLAIFLFISFLLFSISKIFINKINLNSISIGILSVSFK
jgi:hypothetical protein